MLLALGACVSLYAGWLLFHAQPVAKIESHSLAYDCSGPGSGLVLALYLPVYVAASVLPFFVSCGSRTP